MKKFIVGTFAILAWAFYEMSGGGDFEPDQRIAELETPAPETETEDVPVSRADTADLQQLTETVSSRELVVLPAQPQPADTVRTDTPAADPGVERAQTTAPRTEGSQTTSAEAEPMFASLSTGSVTTAAPINPIRTVDARAVNMREGPGTEFSVLDTLTRGTEAEIMDQDGTGWVRVYIPGTGMTGWMAERLLTGG